MKFLITGGAGFIGASLIKLILKKKNNTVINIDKLIYPESKKIIKEFSSNKSHKFFKIDICNHKKIRNIIFKFKPDKIIHLAAESHVDSSIFEPEKFIRTNVFGTMNLLNCAYSYWKKLDKLSRKKFIFHHISTDEVYGSISNKKFFDENSKYNPNSPYSASKASSDHLVRAWNRTYGLPTIITNCSNNYGPYQFPEKLIPLTIFKAINKKPIPIYGNGKQIRDWIYVDDHARALYLLALKAKSGHTYNIGSNCEKKNIQVVYEICDILDRLLPNNLKKNESYKNFITYVSDRPGHDFRYAINASKIKKEFNWKPKETFETGLFKTVKWYLDNINLYDKSINKNFEFKNFNKLLKKEIL